MADYKDKSQLKDVFSGISSLWYQSTPIDMTDLTGLQITPEYDVPVKVDTITFEQGDPTIEHYKVIGLAGDWITSSESGDIEISFRVPTKETNILKMAYGADAVSEDISATVTVGSDESTFVGEGLVLKQTKVSGTFILVNDDQTKLLILGNTNLWAKPVIDSDSKGVFALDFNGSIESDGVNPDVLFLTKNSGTSS